MPIVNGAYDAPTWNNNAPPAIDASELQDMCDTIETYNTQKADVDYVNTFVRPNLLDNWYFVGGGSQQGGGQFPINQRGATSYTADSAYAIDRWKLTPRGGSLSVQSDGLHLYPGTTGTKVSFISQKYENPADLYNQTCTLSFLLEVPSGTSGQIRFMNSAYSPITGGSKSFTAGATLVTLTVPVTSDFDNVGILNSSGSTGAIKILACKLEIGSTQTLAHQENGVWVLNEMPNYQQELAKCQRYCVAIPEDSGAYANFAEGIADATTSVGCILTLPVPMRTAPTISSTGSFRLSGSTSMSTIAVTGFSVYSSPANPGGAMIGIKATVASGLSVGYPYVLLRANDSQAQILLSADL